MFRHKKKIPKKYDQETQEPVLRVSICTGETVAGFRSRTSGEIEEVMLIRDDRNLEEFMNQYGLTEVPRKVY